MAHVAECVDEDYEEETHSAEHGLEETSYEEEEVDDEYLAQELSALAEIGDIEPGPSAYGVADTIQKEVVTLAA